MVNCCCTRYTPHWWNQTNMRISHYHHALCMHKHPPMHTHPSTSTPTHPHPPIHTGHALLASLPSTLLQGTASTKATYQALTYFVQRVDAASVLTAHPPLMHELVLQGMQVDRLANSSAHLLRLLLKQLYEEYDAGNGTVMVWCGCGCVECVLCVVCMWCVWYVYGVYGMWCT